MMLTTEQRVALEWAMDVMGDCDAQDAIGDMLSQSVPAWQVTEERQAALKGLIEHCRLTGNPDTSMLQVMLAEVPK